MSKRLLILIAALAGLVLAAGAAPAVTADSDTGTVDVSITTQEPAAPCMTVTPGSVDFGTLQFSASNTTSQATADITLAFCGTATGQNLLGATTPAIGSSGSWTPRNDDGLIQPCVESNQFYLSLNGFNANPQTRSIYMTGTPAPVLTFSGGPAVFSTGAQPFRLIVIMPCQGSNGAGETKKLTATFTAVLP